MTPSTLVRSYTPNVWETGFEAALPALWFMAIAKPGEAKSRYLVLFCCFTSALACVQLPRLFHSKGVFLIINKRAAMKTQQKHEYLSSPVLPGNKTGNEKQQVSKF